MTATHQLSLVTDAPSVIGWWDSRRLERVLDNLLSNAIKYSPDGGDILIEVAGRNANNWIEMLGGDTGVGIATDDLPYIFERYRRGVNAATVAVGSGIGLAGARQFVERHGGEITVTSGVEHGGTFTIQLPRNPPNHQD